MMEILKIFWNLNIAFNINDDATKVMGIAGYLSTKQYSAPPPTNDGALLDYVTGTTEISPSPSTATLISFRYDRHGSRSGHLP